MILLDTHTWIWWVSDPANLSAAATGAIDTARDSGKLYISSISCWEISLLVRKKRLRLDRPLDDWIAASEALPFLRFLPVDNRVALRSNRLGEAMHDDPADRMIAATASIHGLKLVTKDHRLLDNPDIDTLW